MAFQYKSLSSEKIQVPHTDLKAYYICNDILQLLPSDESHFKA